MNILCPNCQSSIPFSQSEPIFKCSECGYTSNISKLGTAPGTAMAPVLRDLSGESIGDYKIEQLIGMGGMGVVYRGLHKGDKNHVAIKLLGQTNDLNREEFVARFKREIKALSTLEHPNIVTILDSGEEEEVYYLVTELVQGENLSSYLKSNELTPKEIFTIMKQVTAAISYAHEKGIVHRDIKPANIVMSDGVPKVLDFGLAQISISDTNMTTLTRTDLAMGTFNYLSPEQRKGAREVDARTDIFSLGVVLFEMLTGELPMGSFEPPSMSRKDVGKDCDQVVLKSLSPNPGDRFQSAKDFQAAIVELDNPKPKARMWLVVLAICIAVFAIIFVSIGQFQEGSPKVEPQIDLQNQAQATNRAPDLGEKPINKVQTIKKTRTKKKKESARSSKTVSKKISKRKFRKKRNPKKEYMNKKSQKSRKGKELDPLGELFDSNDIGQKK